MYALNSRWTTMTLQWWQCTALRRYLTAAVSRWQSDSSVPSGTVECEARIDAAQSLQPTYWPTIADLRYFDSELRMAFVYVQLARDAPASNVRVCADRAEQAYLALTEWVRANGGHEPCERQLQQLKWHFTQLRRHEINER